MAGSVSWEFYRKRKKIEPKKWVEIKGISSYEEFSRELRALGVRVPPEHSVFYLFETKKEKTENVKVDPAKETKTTKKRKTRRKIKIDKELG